MQRQQDCLLGLMFSGFWVYGMKVHSGVFVCMGLVFFVLGLMVYTFIGTRILGFRLRGFRVFGFRVNGSRV